MSKYHHRSGYACTPIQCFFAGQWRGRFLGARVRQPLTDVTTLFTLATVLFATVLFATVFFARIGSAWARPLVATAPSLGTAASFTVLGGSTVTNVGPTIVTGDLGVSPGTAIIGFPPGVVSGTIHANDAVAVQAQADATVAYNNLAGQACNTSLTGQDLGGLTLTPGVYCFDTSAQLTGALTLDGLGDPNGIFIFKIGSTLTTASAASVLLINGASSCNVFWQVSSSATLGTTTTFVGNVLANASITLDTGANLSGRALAQTGAVTMDANTISQLCIVAPTNTATPTATATATSIATDIATSTATAIATPIATDTATSTATAIAAPTATDAALSTATGTATPTATDTALSTATGTATPTATDAALSTNTVTPTNTPTLTPTPVLGRVEIDKVFCPSTDSARTEFQVFPPQVSEPSVSARRIATCETRSGVAFTVKNNNGQVVATVQTGAGGIVEFALPPGTYALIENANSASTTFLVEANKLTAIFVHNFESGEVNLTKFFCASGDTGTIISVNGAPQPQGQSGCRFGDAQFQIDGGPVFAVGSTGIRVFLLGPGTHTIVEVATATRAKFTVKAGQTTTIVVYNFPSATPTTAPTKTPANTSTPYLTKTPTPTKTLSPPTKAPTKTPTKTKTPPTSTPTKTLAPTRTPTKTLVPPTKAPTKTPTPYLTKTPTNTPTVTPTPAPGEVKLIKFFCASGDTGTIIAVNGAPQPQGQNGCLFGDAQFQIDGGPVFAVGSSGIRVFSLLAGAHTIVEVATATRAKFTVKAGHITTIVVYNFPRATPKVGAAGQTNDGSTLDGASPWRFTLTTPYTIFMPLVSR